MSIQTTTGCPAGVRAASGAWVAMHPAEQDSLPSRAWDAATGPERDLAWLRSCGVPAEVAAGLKARDQWMPRITRTSPR